MDTQQFQAYVVCQVCGRTTPKDDAEGWLDQPHKDMLGIRVQRCPWHISEWALRHTREGRTKQNRELAARGREMPMPPIPPSASPFPMRDREEV